MIRDLLLSGGVGALIGCWAWLAFRLMRHGRR